MPTLGPLELVVILVLALLILGPKKLPEAGKSLGRGIREFKNSISNHDPEPIESHSVQRSEETEPSPK
jgi:sec-independent protein translocase protein TatA